MPISYAHFNLMPESIWQWNHFTPRELACPHCFEIKIEPRLVDLLESVRLIYGAPITIASGYRCPTHNTAIKGAENSPHLRGTAVDPKDPGNGPARYKMIRAFFNAGFEGFGMGDGKLHFDIDSLGMRAWHYPRIGA